MSICIYQLLCFCWPKKKKMSSQMLIKSFVGIKGVANRDRIRVFVNSDNKRCKLVFLSYSLHNIFYFKLFKLYTNEWWMNTYRLA